MVTDQSEAKWARAGFWKLPAKVGINFLGGGPRHVGGVWGQPGRWDGSWWDRVQTVAIHHFFTESRPYQLCLSLKNVFLPSPCNTQTHNAQTLHICGWQSDYASLLVFQHTPLPQRSFPWPSWWGPFSLRLSQEFLPLHYTFHSAQFTNTLQLFESLCQTQ